KGVFVPPRMDRYRQESKLIMALLVETGAMIEPMSIDEAYMDLSQIVACARLDSGAGVPPVRTGVSPAKEDSFSPNEGIVAGSRAGCPAEAGRMPAPLPLGELSDIDA